MVNMYLMFKKFPNFKNDYHFILHLLCMMVSIFPHLHKQMKCLFVGVCKYTYIYIFIHVYMSTYIANIVKCVLVSHCDLNLHFPNKLKHLFMCY